MALHIVIVIAVGIAAALAGLATPEPRARRVIEPPAPSVATEG